MNSENEDFGHEFERQQQQGNEFQCTPLQKSPQQPYGQPQQNKSTLGLVGLILSIVSVFGCGALLAIPGVICCIVCLVKNKKDVKSIVGVVIGAVSMIVWLVIWGLVFNMVVKDHVLEDSRTYYENQIDKKETEENIEKNNDKDTESFLKKEDSKKQNTEKSDEQASNIKAGTDVAGDFDPTNVVYNGNTLQIDVLTATDVQNLLGVQFESKKMDLVINPQYYDWITYHPDDNINHVVYFYFYNNGQEAIKLSDCKLYRVGFESEDYPKGGKLSDWLNADFGSGLNQLSTMEQVKAVLGEPDYTHDSDDGTVHKIEYYKKWDFQYRASFQFNGDGSLSEVYFGIY